MPKPENRATRRLRMARGIVSQPEHHEEPQRSTPTWLGRKMKAIVELLSAISAVVGIAFAVHDALEEPQIHPQIAQTSAPFSLHFSFHNPSLIFSMNEIQIQCHIDDVIAVNYTRYTGFNVTANEPMISIPPGKTRQYNCPFQKVVLDLPPIETARIILDVQFKTLFIQRHTASETFSWNKDSKQWIEGEIIK